jgi:hypothetical protein
MTRFGFLPCLEEALSEIAVGGHEECGGAGGNVADLKCKDFGRRSQLPLLTKKSFCGTSVDKRLERVLHNRLSETARRIVVAGFSSAGALSEFSEFVRALIELFIS